MPFLPPNQQRKALKANRINYIQFGFIVFFGTYLLLLLSVVWKYCGFEFHYIRQVNGVNGEIYCDAFFRPSVNTQYLDANISKTV